MLVLTQGLNVRLAYFYHLVFYYYFVMTSITIYSEEYFDYYNRNRTITANTALLFSLMKFDTAY